MAKGHAEARRKAEPPTEPLGSGFLGGGSPSRRPARWRWPPSGRPRCVGSRPVEVATNVIPERQAASDTGPDTDFRALEMWYHFWGFSDTRRDTNLARRLEFGITCSASQIRAVIPLFRDDSWATHRSWAIHRFERPFGKRLSGGPSIGQRLFRVASPSGSIFGEFCGPRSRGKGQGTS